MQQQLGHVAGTEDLVNRRELRRPLLSPEVGHKHAATHTLPSQKFARTAWCSTAHGGGYI